MPSQRFFNLTDEKRQRIVSAAIRELSNVSVDNLSINKIIKDAEIPRGSFYEYFEDKFDLVDYILDDFRVQMINYCEKCLDEVGGNIFALFENLFSFILDFATEKNRFKVFQNIFSCMKYAEFNNFDSIFSERNNLVDKLYVKLNLSNMNVKSKQDLLCLVDILLGIFKSEIVITFMNKIDLENSKKMFCKKLNMLKNGVYA